jgi:replicative DNA helicase
LLIHREAVFKKARTAASDNSAELIIAKQRNGPTGSLFLTFLDHISRFENYASVG